MNELNELNVFEKNITETLIALNQLLTSKAKKDCTVPIINNYIIGNEYYLADGGYSRIYINIDDKRFHLTSNSLDNVKEKWNNNFAVRVLKSYLMDNLLALRRRIENV